VTFILFIILRIWCYFLVSFNYYCATVPPLNELKQGCICQISTRTVTDVDTQTSSAVGWQTVKIDPPHCRQFADVSSFCEWVRLPDILQTQSCT